MEESEAGESMPHEEIWGKPADEVVYGEYCIICNSRIDEFGLCSCGAGSA